MKRIAFVITLLALWQPAAAPAQQPPEPILRVALEAPRVVVGQMTSLAITVLVPNYMTAPPVLPDFQVRNAVTRQLRSVNQSEERNGVTYAGVRFEFAIYPQEPGSYAIVDRKIMVRYAAQPPQAREATLSLPRIEFQAFIPDEAARLNPFVSAGGLTVEQIVRRSSEPLKVGDAVTRIVTTKAEGTPAMLLPPANFASVNGLAVYPAQPVLEDKSDARTDLLTASRVDQATYMLEQAGDYLLPSIELPWWNVRTQKIERAHVDAVALQVAAAPAAPGVPGQDHTARSIWRGGVDLIADHWLAGVLAVVLVVLLASLLPRAIRRVTARRRERHRLYGESERYAFARLRTAVRHREASKAYFALLDWLERFRPGTQDHSVDSFKRTAHDRVLDTQIDVIETRLYGFQETRDEWSPRTMLHRLAAARRRLGRGAVRADASCPLPQDLNPEYARDSSKQRWRPVARLVL